MPKRSHGPQPPSFPETAIGVLSGSTDAAAHNHWSGIGPVLVCSTGPEADQTTKTGPKTDRAPEAPEEAKPRVAEARALERPCPGAGPIPGEQVKWLFLDMSSFFASCEQYDNPALRGRPVGGCPVLANGGVIVAASYEAKRFGVGMMRAAEARRVCPGITLLQARPDRYVELHHAVMKSIEKHLPITTTYSIDEWAIRLMGDERRAATARAIAERMQQQIADDFDGALSCSVGLAPSRLLAKTACELKKPNGLTVLTLGQMPDILSPMKLRDIPGIGSGMDLRLRQNDVTTPAELWALSWADCRRI